MNDNLPNLPKIAKNEAIFGHFQEKFAKNRGLASRNAKAMKWG